VPRSVDPVVRDRGQGCRIIVREFGGDAHGSGLRWRGRDGAVGGLLQLHALAGVELFQITIPWP
jgi:hypothetical protein